MSQAGQDLLLLSKEQKRETHDDAGGREGQGGVPDEITVLKLGIAHLKAADPRPQAREGALPEGKEGEERGGQADVTTGALAVAVGGFQQASAWRMHAKVCCVAAGRNADVASR